MARTPSTMLLPLGSKAPDFQLLDVIDNSQCSLVDFSDRHALLIMFICNHCPFVIHVREEFSRLGRDYGDTGLGIIAINSNDVANYPDDSPDKMRELAVEEGWNFPYLFDEDQSVAKAYQAACTPDFFLFDGDQQLVYRGQLDGSRPGNDVPVDGTDLRAAIDAVLSGASIPDPQVPSLGCNIKWKPGNEPDFWTQSLS
ncbi:MAG: thioredoxin family protein [Myxococcales bacterium]|nr:thioredoxin family protein [Myxococcales bacterium]